MSDDLFQYAVWAIEVLASLIIGGLGGYWAFKGLVSIRKRMERPKAAVKVASRPAGMQRPSSPTHIRDVIAQAGMLQEIEPNLISLPKVNPARVYGYLTIVNGIDQRREKFAIEHNHFEIGRDPLCDISLDDANVSRLHAILFVRNQRVEIADLTSTNGTHVNGQKIAAITMLNENDQVQIGQTIFHYSLSLEDR